jgi:hypothetical protein
MVAIPITDDQPGVAARIAWTGTGELVSLSQLSATKLQKAIRRVLTEESYRQNAIRLQEKMRQTKGVNHAVDIIEQAVSTKSPVIWALLHKYLKPLCSKDRQLESLIEKSLRSKAFGRNTE